MKAFIRVIFLIVILIIILAGFFGYMAYQKLPGFLEERLSEKLGVPVKIEKINFSPGSFEIVNFTISNHPGSALPTAFKANTIRFKAPYMNYLRPHIVINQVAIDGVYVGIEFYDKDNTNGNWTKIIQELNGDDKKKAKAPKERTVLIKHLVFTDINVELILQQLGRKNLYFAKIEFTDITSEKGLPMEEITELITQKLMEQLSIMGGFSNMLKGVLFLPKEAAEVFISPFQMLFGKPKQQQGGS